MNLMAPPILPAVPTGGAPASHDPVAPRRRIAVVGHACSPYLGSEPGFTWKWSTHLAAHHEVYAFVHPEHRDDIEAEMQKHPIPGLHWIFVDVDHPLDYWQPNTNERGIRLHYMLWQRNVVKAVADQHQQTPFDIVHHVSWGSLNQPPLLWKTGIPFVWGPIGGGQTWPTQFLQYAGSRMREKMRTAMVRWSHLNPSIRRAASRAALVCATNRETAALLTRAGAGRVELLLDSGIFPVEGDFERKRPPGTPMTVLWAGRLEPRKALPLALEAMTRIKQPVRMLVAGDGPERRALEEMVQRLGLSEKVNVLGQVPYKQMFDLFAQSDVFLFTSLRDSMGSVVLEAMSTGLPVVALDHQGAAVAVTPETGIKVAVTNPQQTVADLAEAIDRLAADPALRRQKSEAVIASSSDNTWVRRAEKMSQWYEEVLRANRRV